MCHTWARVDVRLASPLSAFLILESSYFALGWAGHWRSDVAMSCVGTFVCFDVRLETQPNGGDARGVVFCVGLLRVLHGRRTTPAPHNDAHVNHQPTNPPSGHHIQLPQGVLRPGRDIHWRSAAGDEQAEDSPDVRDPG